MVPAFVLALALVAGVAVGAEGGRQAAAGPLAVSSVTIDRSIGYQTIEGFGFFGPKEHWWDTQDPARFHDRRWLDDVIDDLGVTMWRNELVPNNPVTAKGDQDADWAKQLPMLRALKAKADASHVPLKFILTVWSPPAEWKVDARVQWAMDPAATRGGRHGKGTRGGGAIDPAHYGNYARWLVDGLRMYQDAGIDVYALSLQNEPLFEEPYNSAVYTVGWYADLLESVVPRVKTGFPGVKIYGAENMLEMEGSRRESRSFYHAELMRRPAALAQLDRWAVHGYTDGAAATAVQRHAALWRRHYEQFQVPTSKPAWMTETSGYDDTWNTASTDAFDLGIAIHAMLYYGKGSAWVYWYGAGDLLDGDRKTRRYHVSRQFFRFIRPGARMVKLASPDPQVLGAAFEHRGLAHQRQ